MPNSLRQATKFLETQWSSLNENKVKGIRAELAFKAYLKTKKIHYVPGGWIVQPGNNSKSPIPPRDKICIIPRSHRFEWQESTSAGSGYSVAEIAAYNHFRQVGLPTYFASPLEPLEKKFTLPKARRGKTKAIYPRPYHLELSTLSHGASPAAAETEKVFGKFPHRRGALGLRCYCSGRISSTVEPWSNADAISDIFWFEYARYFFQVDYLLSNNDLDLFIVGQSGSCYPVELKSKNAAHDKGFGDWFGIDVGPFAKLSFFTSNAMKNDALYVVREVEDSTHENHLGWLGIRFTDLVKSCSWVQQGGGKSMSGSNSSTYRIPKAAFTPLDDLLPLL